MNLPLRIGLLTPLYEWEGSSRSGIAKHYRHLAEELGAQGHIVTVVFVPDFHVRPPAASTTVTPEGIRVICRPVHLPSLIRTTFARRGQQLALIHSARAAALAAGIMRRLAPGLDAVEATSFGALGLGSLAGPGWPACITRVSTTGEQISAAFQSHRSRAQSLINQLERIAILRSPALLTHSRRHAATIERELGLAAGSFALIPHGLPDSPSTGQPAPFPRWDAGPTLLFAGQFIRRKAIDVVLEAAPRFLTLRPDARMVIAGGPAIEPGTMRSLHPLQAIFGERLVFIPEPDDATLDACLRNCDMFTAPSRYESFGLMYLEAMRAGKPVIATHAGGIPEVVADQETGLLVPPGDPAALAEAWLRLAADPARRLRYGEAGRRRFLADFTASVMATRSARLYAALNAGAARRPASGLI